MLATGPGDRLIGPQGVRAGQACSHEDLLSACLSLLSALLPLAFPPPDTTHTWTQKTLTVANFLSATPQAPDISIASIL